MISMAQWIFRGIPHGGRSFWLCGIRDVASKDETHVAFDVVHLMRDLGILKAAPSNLMTSGAMSPPPAM